MSIMTDLRKKKFLLAGLSVMLGATMLATGCGKKSASGGGSAGGDKPFFIGYTNAPSGFNPIFNADTSASYINHYMYDTLLGQPEINKFTPHLALSIDTTDKQTYTIKLNPKAKWSDGKPITADDVIYTLNLIANPKVPTSKGRYITMLAGLDAKGKLTSGTAIPGLVAKDANTVEFKCKAPLDPNYVKGLLGFEVGIMPKHVFEKIDPTKLSTAPEVTSPKVFSGPYKFVKYVTNDHLELAANEDYVNGAPKLKKVFLKFENGTNLVVDLKAGKLDMVAGGGVGIIPIKDLDMLKQEKKLVIKQAPSSTSQILIANNSNPAFNVHFRRALTMAVNRKQIVDQLFKGYAHVFPTIYSNFSPVYDANIKPLPHDVEAAKKELAQSGYDVSKKITMLVPLGNVLREQSADIIQQNLKAIGLNVELQKLDFPTMHARAMKGDFEMLLIGLAISADPDYSNYYTPGSAGNYSHTDDAKLNELFTAGATKTDFNERKAIYQQIQQYLKDQQFVTMLYAPDFIIGQSVKLEGGVKEFWDGSLDGCQNWTMKN